MNILYMSTVLPYLVHRVRSNVLHETSKIQAKHILTCVVNHTQLVRVMFLSHGVFESTTACCEAGVEDVVMATVANDQVTTA